MKTNSKLNINPQLGTHIGIPAPIDSANELRNVTYDPKTKAWCTTVGFEKYFSNNNNLVPFNGSAQREVDSVYCFQQHNGARQSLLFETNGRLYVINGSSENFDQIASGRNIPTPTQPHTSYEPYGRYVIISNGIDGPIKFRGQGGGKPSSEMLTDLGWRQLPGSPRVRAVGDPDEQPVTFLDASNTLINNQIWDPEDSTYQGITSTTASEVSSYSYKVSFVNEAGSESPLSQASNVIEYTAQSVTRGSASGVPSTGFIVDIPRGPNGTLARRIYRTKNGGITYFFLTQLNENGSNTITDFAPDSQLGAEAPALTDSVLMPSPACKFTATFKNCLFIDGGEMDPTRLYFSNPLQPDTFSAFDFFEVGTREGGDITGLAPYYNSLLVFRENAIDLVRGSAGTFELIPFIQGVGTLSPQSIVPIPNLGMSFLSQDGVYLLKGGFDGGADLQLTKLSLPIQEFFDRASRDRLPVAVGAYSQKWRELHYYLTLDGQTFNNIGLVYHVDNSTWSTRTGFPVKSITTDKDGNFVCGYDENNVYSGYSGSQTTGMPAKGGLFVITGCRRQGYVFANIIPNVEEGPGIDAKFRSSWIDFNYPAQKKHVKYLYLHALTTGDVNLDVTVYKDREWANGITSPTIVMQRADHPDQPVYADERYVFGKVNWQDKLLTQIRVDVANLSCSEFAWEFETSDRIEFIGYTVEYQLDQTKTIRGKL